MNKDENKSIGSLTIAELKNLIKECLREFKKEEEERPWDAQYKQLWIKHGGAQTPDDPGFKCGD